MIKISTIVLFLSINLFASNNLNKVLILTKTNAEIKVDGVIDPVWNTVDSVSNFFQLQPYYGKEPSKRTVAKVISTNDALYCLMVCYDDSRNIQNFPGLLDNFGGDVASIMLDTFNDKKTAYKFAVSAGNIKNDCRLLDDARNRDYSWDGIWFAGSKVYNWGFVIEIKIPYKSIQYDENLSEWGLDFDRWIPSLNEDLYWCSYEQNEGQRISKFGKLIFDNFHPAIKGLNLEIYPVAITKFDYLNHNKYKIDPDAGIDILYNPSPKLKFQLTANPDFAQIEADPYEFNISRYESYFSERRPFFTEGNEIFMASGKQRNTGFYKPLELFYSRRIGKKLPDGSEVPLIVGTKAFGRLGDWEYGGFMALTGAKNYKDDGITKTEPRAYFGSARIKKQILDNSSLGVLFVGKQTADNTYGVLDVDGAFRNSDWQLSYQLSRSIKNSEGDFAASAGFVQIKEKWINFARFKYIGEKFDIDQVGFVPWKGTSELTSIVGPVWNFDKGYIKQILLYGGASLYYEKVDEYIDYLGLLGFNMQLRNNWGYEINLSFGKAKDSNVKFSSYEASFSSWFNISPKWNANIYGGYSKTYNFSREYLAFYSWLGSSFSIKIANIFDVGTSYNMWIEGNPDGDVEDIVYNARPFISLTPVNNLNLRLYVDNLYVSSSQHLERIIIGALFSYNFLPKSWIYFAFNELQNRSSLYAQTGELLPASMHVAKRAGVVKIKYLYYF